MTETFKSFKSIFKSCMNLTVFLLILTTLIVTYKIVCLNSSNKYFDDRKIEQFLNQTSYMSKDFDMEFKLLCESNSEFCVPKFQELKEAFVRKIVAVPNIKLASCILPKCASTITTQAFSYLYDNVTFESFNWTNSIGLSSSHHKNDFDSFRTFQHNLQLDSKKLSEWRLFASIRDPLHRFISAFVDKCLNERNRDLNSVLYGKHSLCSPCGDNFDCFLREQYKLIANYANNKGQFSTYLLQHIAPQSWFCDFKTHLNDYKLFKYTSDSEGKQRFRTFIKEMLQERKVSEDKINHVLERIIGEVEFPVKNKLPKPQKLKLTGRKGTSLYFKQMAAILTDKLLRNQNNFKIFMAMYYNDYKVFNYEIPKLIKV